MIWKRPLKRTNFPYLVKLHGSINKSSMWLNEQKKLGIHFPSHNEYPYQRLPIKAIQDPFKMRVIIKTFDNWTFTIISLFHIWFRIISTIRSTFSHYKFLFVVIWRNIYNLDYWIRHSFGSGLFQPSDCPLQEFTYLCKVNILIIR